MSEQTEIVEFKQSEAALATLREKYAVVPDFTTKDGYEEGRQGIAELRTLRTNLDKARKRLNKDDQDRIKYRNSEAKRITSELVSLEDPLKVAKGEFDMIAEREAEAARKVEEDRISAIEEKMEWLSDGITVANEKYDDIKMLNEMLTALDKHFSEFDWQEFQEAADLERIKVKEHIQKVIHKREVFETEQAELEKEKEKMRLQKEELAKEQERQRLINQAEEKKLADERAELKAQQDKIEAERQEAARVMREAQEKAEAEKLAAEKAAEEKRLAEEKAVRQEALKPDKEKLHDWIAKLRTIDAPAGLKSEVAIRFAGEVMASLDNLATDYLSDLEVL